MLICKKPHMEAQIPQQKAILVAEGSVLVLAEPETHEKLQTGAVPEPYDPELRSIPLKYGRFLYKTFSRKTLAFVL